MSVRQTKVTFTRSHIDLLLKDGVVFSTSPSSCVVGWGQLQQSSQYLPGIFAIYSPDFYLENPTPWIYPEFWAEVSREELAVQLLDFEAPTHGWSWEEPSESDFAVTLESLKTRIQSGEILKAVPVVFERAQEKINPVTLASLLKNLMNSPGSLQIYGYWENSHGILGATPEELFTISEDRVLRTMAVAGTHPLTEDLKKIQMFLESPKERLEHQIVVDDLRIVLSQWGEVRVGVTELFRLPQLFHLKTNLQVKLKHLPNFDDLVYAFHPTPALGVAPRKLGLGWMKSLDDLSRRKRFGAPFGMALPSGGMCCLVAIRNIEWQGLDIQLGSGCGIVDQSELASEWRELQAKRHSVKMMMGLN